MVSRRRFIQQAGVACIAGATVNAQKKKPKKEAWPIIFFEKPVQNLAYEEIFNELAQMGAQGIEATIRKGGHIEPQNAAKEAPSMMQALESAGLTTVIAATRVLKADQSSRDFLKALRDSGITQYRTDYYKYSKKGNPLEEAHLFHDEAKALAELNEELGMQAIYQIHSGGRCACSLLWDAALIFEGINPDHFAVGYDLRHSKTDTGNSWEVSAQLIKKHLRAIYIKDARWGGERSNQLENVPLDTGFVNEDMFEFVRDGMPPMPISLHTEWGAHQLYPKETAREAWPMIRRDMATLKKWRDS